jgi:outer membrane protein TolC
MRPRKAALGVLAAAVLWLALAVAEAADAQPVTLEQVVRQALSRNERSRIADLGVVTADAAVGRARAGFLPTVTLAGSETLRPQTLEQNGRVAVRSNAASSTVTVNQPLLAATAFPLYASARHGFEAARFSALDQRRQLGFDAARGYFAIVAQQRVLTAAKRRLERAEANLADTRARAEAQIVSSNDATRSQIDRANAQQSVSTAEGAVAQARINLEYIVNGPVEGDVRPVDTSLVPAALELPSLVNLALAQRPDLGASVENTRAAQASADEPSLRLVPTLGASAQARLADQTIAADRYYDTMLTLNLSWTIWDAGIRSADAQSRRAAADVADLQSQALRRRVVADVRNAVAELTAARASAVASADAVAAATKSAEETTVLYNQGLARAIELIDSNLSRYDAEVALVGAQLALRQAELDLRAALGMFPIDGVQ